MRIQQDVSQIIRIRGDTVPDQRDIVDLRGNPVDLTGFQFLLTINLDISPDDTTDQLLQIIGSISDGGVVQFHFSEDDADQPIGKYFYDIQQRDSNGLIQTIERGEYIFIQDITK